MKRGFISGWGVGGRVEVLFSVIFLVGLLFGELGFDFGELLLIEDFEKYGDIYMRLWVIYKVELYWLYYLVFGVIDFIVVRMISYI